MDLMERGQKKLDLQVRNKYDKDYWKKVNERIGDIVIELEVNGKAKTGDTSTRYFNKVATQNVIAPIFALATSTCAVKSIPAKARPSS